MAARSIATATISFGLVTVPVRLYPATTQSAGLSFHLLHRKDGVRLKQQYVCPKDDEVVPRSEMIKGYEYAKDRYVTFTDEELKALDAQVTHGIEITEFVPLASVDPVYFERAYYLGPDKGGDKPYALLVSAMAEMRLAALARYAARGKDYLVLLRPIEGRLVLQQLYHADEVRPLSEVPAAERDVREAEMKLARQLISQIAAERFDPAKYADEVRRRIRKAIEEKVEGHAPEQPEPARQRGQVVDLMEALKASLGAARRPRAAPRPARSSARRRQPRRSA